MKSLLETKRPDERSIEPVRVGDVELWLAFVDFQVAFHRRMSAAVRRSEREVRDGA